MNNIFFPFFLIILTTLVGFSQKSDFVDIKDSITFKLNLTENSKKIYSIESNFIQEKHLAFLNDVIISTGIFKFKKENKIRWEYKSPYQYLVVINGSKITIKDENKTNVIDAKNNKVFEEINKIVSYCLNGSILNANKEFILKYFENNSMYLIKMSPKNNEVKKYLHEIELYINKSDLSVSKMKMNESSDDYTLIIFSNIKQNSIINDEAFTVN